ncbi:hypothetical protein Tsubulata_022648 [Turnera subulata]|uniref:Uncharacterized protein n=1 Tax=Turnera subulata TaxID=218843 RepID=A0A9Q0G683_9ROSI|nr:hypothetical protein Tsubulata_022648 [Turnera subulata]
MKLKQQRTSLKISHCLLYPAARKLCMMIDVKVSPHSNRRRSRVRTMEEEEKEEKEARCGAAVAEGYFHSRS